MKKKFDKTFVYLVGAARKIWRWSHERNKVKKEAKNCIYCNTKFTKYNPPEVDHITPVGRAPRGFTGWDIYYQRLFLGKMQPLCHYCHKKKTAKERLARKEAK